VFFIRGSLLFFERPHQPAGHFKILDNKTISSTQRARARPRKALSIIIYPLRQGEKSDVGVDGTSRPWGIDPEKKGGRRRGPVGIRSVGMRSTFLGQSSPGTKGGRKNKWASGGGVRPFLTFRLGSPARHVGGGRAGIPLSVLASPKVTAAREGNAPAVEEALSINKRAFFWFWRFISAPRAREVEGAAGTVRCGLQRDHLNSGQG